MSCTCDVSYICDECQAKIEVERMRQFEREWREWVGVTLQAIAQHAGIAHRLPEPPEEPK